MRITAFAFLVIFVLSCKKSNFDPSLLNKPTRLTKIIITNIGAYYDSSTSNFTYGYRGDLIQRKATIPVSATDRSAWYIISSQTYHSDYFLGITMD